MAKQQSTAIASRSRSGSPAAATTEITIPTSLDLSGMLPPAVVQVVRAQQEKLNQVQVAETEAGRKLMQTLKRIEQMEEYQRLQSDVRMLRAHIAHIKKIRERLSYSISDIMNESLSAEGIPGDTLLEKTEYIRRRSDGRR